MSPIFVFRPSLVVLGNIATIEFPFASRPLAFLRTSRPSVGFLPDHRGPVSRPGARRREQQFPYRLQVATGHYIQRRKRPGEHARIVFVQDRGAR